MIKKDIKNVLTPDWRKILVTFIVFMTFPFSTQISVCGIGGCSDYNVVLLVGMEFFNHISEYGLSPTEIIVAMSLILFFYLLACLLVLFYEKMKDYIMGEFV